MKRKISYVLALVLICCVMLTGCTKTFSLTYNIETGDSVKVTLEMSNGEDYKLKSNGSGFVITDADGTTLLTGKFFSQEQYEDLIAGYEAYGVSSSGTVGNYELYQFVNSNGEDEFDYLCSISGASVYGVVYSNEQYDDVVKLVSFANNK